MKKNVMMRLASGLLIAVLLTTCAIAGTFAKYTTTASGSDTARVAKWGVEVTANGETFKINYDNTAISSAADEDIVAPGTSGSLVAMDLSGSPEVKVEVSYQSTLTLTGWEVDGDEYCPIVFTIGTETYGTNMTGIVATHKYDSIAELKTAVEAAIGDYTAQYDANVDLSMFAETPNVSWSWAFEVDDVKDTKLGNAANAVSPATIALAITTTVTQID